MQDRLMRQNFAQKFVNIFHLLIQDTKVGPKRCILIANTFICLLPSFVRNTDNYGTFINYRSYFQRMEEIVLRTSLPGLTIYLAVSLSWK